MTAPGRMLNASHKDRELQVGAPPNGLKNTTLDLEGVLRHTLLQEIKCSLGME